MDEAIKRLKLGFSGGGFRATFYCLGAYRRLVELNLHSIVTDITSVSGGSITAGAIMVALSNGDFVDLDDFDNRVTAPLRRLGQIDLRARLISPMRFPVRVIPACLKLGSLLPIGLGLGFARYAYSSITEQATAVFPTVLDEELFHGKMLGDLPRVPEWSCNATCLNTLKRFRFKPVNIYGNKIGISNNVKNILVSTAVAASAAYPLLFAPMKFSVSDREFINEHPSEYCIEKPEILYLTDGGVYDNLGSENLHKDATPYIMLDASAEAYCWDANAQPTNLELLSRTLDASMDQNVALRRRLLFQNMKTNGIQLLISKPISQIVEAEKKYRTTASLPSYENVDQTVESAIARLRTDLDSFHDAEIDLLLWSGAIRMDLAVRVLLKDLFQYRVDVPTIPVSPSATVMKILSQGSKRSLWGKVHNNLHNMNTGENTDGPLLRNMNA